ncbi:MAG: hypothetical protein QGF99_01475 [Acidimicrobiales bacterium]|nr:hypothetical protein [Acidimicrobiales bacterium]MDP6900640.1 hypothetical protein [Acidimicrobiales bacterium]HJL98942.1 hypothetical protein [Acidimicrobiales bacterium]
MTASQSEDPVLRSRERVRMAANLGKRLGYSCFGGALVLFVVNYYLGGSSLSISLTVALLIVGSVILAPAIIFGYAANAADREDQGLPHGH